MAKAAETCMPMYNFDLLSDYDVAKDGKEREDSWQSRLSIDDEERNMINFESVCEVPDTSSTFVCMGYDNYFMAAIDEFSRQLIDMGFYSSWLWKEEVADHGNVVRHLDCLIAGVKTETVYAYKKQPDRHDWNLKYVK